MSVPVSDESNHDAEIIAAAISLNVLGTVAVLIRFVSKWMTHRAFLAEDWLLLGAWAFATGPHITTAMAIQWGLGRHQSTLTPEQLSNFGKYILVLLICQPTTLALSKLSVLWLLRRIFITRAFHIAVYTLMGVVLAWYLSVLFADIFACKPVQSHWDPTTGGECGDLAVLDIVSPLPWIVTDLAILIAPLPLVVRLQLPLAQKLGVLAIFLIGITTTIVSCFRYKAMFFDPEDVTWSATAAALLTMAEAQTAVVCAALLASKGAFSALTRRDSEDSPEELGFTPTSGWQSRVVSPQRLSRRTSWEAMDAHSRDLDLDNWIAEDQEESASTSDLSRDKHISVVYE